MNPVEGSVCCRRPGLGPSSSIPAGKGRWRRTSQSSCSHCLPNSGGGTAAASGLGLPAELVARSQRVRELWSLFHTCFPAS